MGRPAPASYTDFKLGAKRDGSLTAMEIGMVWDNGAASGWHGNIAGMLFNGAYLVPNMAYTAYEVSTHKTPVDAYRAPGGTQAFFVLEAHRMDGRIRRGEPVKPMRLFHWSTTYLTIVFVVIAVDALLRT